MFLSLTGVSLYLLVSAFADETHLVSTLNFDTWKPPIRVEKKLANRDVLHKATIRESGRKVQYECCKVEKVDSFTSSIKEKTDEELARALSTLEDIEKPPVGYVEPIQVGVSASVYKEGERLFSKVDITVGKETCTVWSNMNFHHTSGVVEYVANGRRYYEGGGVSEYVQLTAKEAGCPIDAPELNGNRAGFLVIAGDRKSKAVVAASDIHDLYEAEKANLVRAYKIYLQNRKLSDAWNRANPPKPRDIKIQFWKRELKKTSK